MMHLRHTVAAIALISVPAICAAQQPTPATHDSRADCTHAPATPMDHANTDHAGHIAALDACAGNAVASSPGQAAFGAIGEVVRILKAHPNTDWGKVNIEALRQHLVDMDEVVMHSAVKQRNVAGGFEADVTGAGPTVAAIRRMTVNHSAMLEQGEDYHASAKEIPNGVRLVVTAKNAADASSVARVRGLGFAGILTESDHHPAHHLAIARGEAVHGR
jgi:hypothetical protein